MAGKYEGTYYESPSSYWWTRAVESERAMNLFRQLWEGDATLDSFRNKLEKEDLEPLGAFELLRKAEAITIDKKNNRVGVAEYYRFYLSDEEDKLIL